MKTMKTGEQTETKEQHTPGPWKVNGSVITALGDMKLTVASVPCKQDRYALADAAAPTFEVRNANARLIAAAPELLEALEAVKVLTAANATHIHQILDAAIAKATGGAS